MSAPADRPILVTGAPLRTTFIGRMIAHPPSSTFPERSTIHRAGRFASSLLVPRNHPAGGTVSGLPSRAVDVPPLVAGNCVPIHDCDDWSGRR
jgi:hypothetical protein